MLKLPVKIILLLSHMSTIQMDSTSNQCSGGCAKMEIKQVHVISSSEREKKEQSGGGREEWRTEREMMKETMVTRMEERWCTARPGLGGWTARWVWSEERLPAVSRCYYGLVCWQGLLRQGDSAPKTPSTAKPSDEQEKLHSFQW